MVIGFLEAPVPQNRLERGFRREKGTVTISEGPPVAPVRSQTGTQWFTALTERARQMVTGFLEVPVPQNRLEGGFHREKGAVTISEGPPVTPVRSQTGKKWITTLTERAR